MSRAHVRLTSERAALNPPTRDSLTSTLTFLLTLTNPRAATYRPITLGSVYLPPNYLDGLTVRYFNIEITEQ